MMVERPVESPPGADPLSLWKRGLRQAPNRGAAKAAVPEPRQAPLMFSVKALLTFALAANGLFVGSAWSWEVASYEPTAILQQMPSPEEAVALRQASNIPLRRLREAHRHAADQGWLGLPAVPAPTAAEAGVNHRPGGDPAASAPRTVR